MKLKPRQTTNLCFFASCSIICIHTTTAAQQTNKQNMAQLSSGRGSIALLGTQALRYASGSMASATAGLCISSPPSAASTITLPNGKTLEVPESDISFHMPAEFEPHSGCWIAWPKRTDVWRDDRRPARAAFTEVIKAVARFEPVTVVAHSEQVSVKCVVSVRQGTQSMM